MQYSFNHSNFYLCSILFITSASIYAVGLFFSSLQLLFMQYSFNHSNFYLCSICFITPASIYAVFFSSLQLLLMQYSFHHSSFYFYSFLLRSSSNTIVAEMFASCEAVFTMSSNYQAWLNNNRPSSEEFKTFVRLQQSFKSFRTHIRHINWS